MSTAAPLRKNVAKAVLFSLLSFFLIPGLTLWFTQYALHDMDTQYTQSFRQNVQGDADMSEEQKSEAFQFLDKYPPSAVCGSDDVQLAEYKADVCAPYSFFWQFHWMKIAAQWIIAGGVAVFLIQAVLGAVAFVNRRLLLATFVGGWRMLTFSSAVEMVVQGIMVVWLSFWLTAYFSESYYPKLIAIAGVLAICVVGYTIVCIFRRPPENNFVDGELLSEDAAPALWARVRELAERMGTAAPDQIIAGIDTNFFVTEAWLNVRGQEVGGRSLYISIPLLRQLDETEADAVLAHELGHLGGGDTASSALLGPRLLKYDHYCHMMRDKGVTIMVFHLMQLYRIIFEFALKRDSRLREFLADRQAAVLVSGRAIIDALVKVAAYASYRAQVEHRLFEHDHSYVETIGIARFIAEGLHPYALSPDFLEAVKAADIPHPFDSHPPLKERMENVGYQIDDSDYATVATSVPRRSWVESITTADEIEARLWHGYEQQFAAAHEENLAYRFRPSDEREEAIVLKYFPPQAFELKGGKQVVVNYLGLVLPDKEGVLEWGDMRNLNYESGIGGPVLTITHVEKGLLGHKSTRAKLPGIDKQKDVFLAAVGRYRHRHHVMLQMQALAGAENEAERRLP